MGIVKISDLMHDNLRDASDALSRVTRMTDQAGHVQQLFRDRLQAHRAFIQQFGTDMPEIEHWRWSLTPAAPPS